MNRWIAVAVLVVLCLPACRMTEEVFHHGEVLTYEQYRTVKTGMTADRVIELYGRPKIVHEDGGKVSRIFYRCETSTGRFRDLELTFDENEVLTKKNL